VTRGRGGRRKLGNVTVNKDEMGRECSMKGNENNVCRNLMVKEVERRN
jgi:hypothetical protein